MMVFSVINPKNKSVTSDNEEFRELWMRWIVWGTTVDLQYNAETGNKSLSNAQCLDLSGLNIEG